MAHKEQVLFCMYIKIKKPQYFYNCKVFDGGSLNINGSNKGLFSHSSYIGCDVGKGDNVDVVSLIHEYKGDDGEFDTVITTECLEHDQHYKKSVLNMIRMLKSNGLFIMSCATTGRPEHGTIKSDGGRANPLLLTDYYKNITESDFKDIFNIPLQEVFSEFEIKVNEQSQDLQFWGIKK